MILGLLWLFEAVTASSRLTTLFGVNRIGRAGATTTKGSAEPFVIIGSAAAAGYGVSTASS